MKGRSLWIDNQPISIFGDEIGSFYYEERALLAATPGDIVIMDYKIEPQYLDKLRKISAYRSVKLICLKKQHSDLVDSILKWEKINLFRNYVNANNYIIRAYIPDERIRLLSQELKLKAYGIRFYEENRSQCSLMVFLNIMKFNKIETLFLNNTNMKSMIDFLERNNYILCKPNLSIGGKGIREISNIVELEQCSKLKESGIEYVLQRKIKSDFEGSVQFLFEDGKFNIYVCKTYNHNNAYTGFSYPCEIKELKQVKKQAKKILDLFMQRYKNDIDSFGIDFIISDGEIFYHDINARKTSVMYVLTLLKRVGFDLEGCKGFKTICLYFEIEKNKSYNELQAVIEMSDIPDLAGNEEGIMIINPGTINLGIVQVVSVSCLGKEKEYLKKFQIQLEKEGVECQWRDIMIQ